MDPTEQVIRRLKLRDLRLLLSVVEEGNIAKAANRLSVSRPVVSKSIADLERVLGARLLDRSPQGLKLTVFGHAFLRRGVAVFDELRQSVREIRFLSDPNSGELAIGASEYMAAGLIPVVTERLSRKYPQLRFKLELADAIGQLRERKVEFVIAHLLSRDAEPDLEMEVLFHEEVFVAAGAGNKWIGRRKIALADLVGEPWMLAPPEIAAGSPIHEAFGNLGLAVPQATVLGLSLPLRNGLLATGRFLTIVPGSVLRFGAERTFLKVLPVKLPRWRLPVAILTLKNRALTPVAKMFIEQTRRIAETLRKVSCIA